MHKISSQLPTVEQILAAPELSLENQSNLIDYVHNNKTL